MNRTSTPAETPAETPTEVVVDDPSTDPGTGGSQTPVDALPEGFPDPASLIGATIAVEWGSAGDQLVTADGVPLELVETLGACFDAGTGDVCAYALDGLAPVGSDGFPMAATAGLVMLLRATGTSGGSTIWQAVDAIVVHPPDGNPALLQWCEGADPAVIYVDESSSATDSIPVAAAWGPNTDSTALVELDPASLSCAWMGD
jgi:hypothetical protein